MIQGKIIGNPGTGKTTTLTSLYEYLTGKEQEDWRKDIAEKILKRLGLDPSEYRGKYNSREVSFVTFTTTAAAELEDRIGGGYIRTLHSLVTSLISKREVIVFPSGSPSTQHPFYKFAREFNIPFNPNNPFSPLFGNKVLNMWSYTKNKHGIKTGSLEKLREYAVYEWKKKYGKHTDRFSKTVEKYEQFKAKKGYVDYDDVLLKALWKKVSFQERDRPKVMFFDEAQDFSPLQWAVVKHLVEDASPDIVLYAGDYNQSIFSFQGADPEFFRTLPAQEIVLERSFRIPKTVYYISQKLIKTINPTTHAYNPREDKGLFKTIYLNEAQEKMLFSKDNNKFKRKFVNSVVARLVSGQDVMILSRTNSQAKKFERLFLEERIPVRSLKINWTSSWERAEPIIETIELIEAGREIDPLDVMKHYLKYTNFSYLIKEDRSAYYYIAKAIGERNMTVLNKNLELIKYKPHVAEMLVHPRKYLSAEIIKKREGDETLEILYNHFRKRFLKLQGNLYVDTFHSSKGREADTVIIYDKLTKAQKECFMDTNALHEEVRVFYVAMTRAKKELVLLLTQESFLEYIARKNTLKELLYDAWTVRID